jgi:hypothetical protein
VGLENVRAGRGDPGSGAGCDDLDSGPSIPDQHLQAGGNDSGLGILAHHVFRIDEEHAAGRRGHDVGRGCGDIP